jgi:hypothetical protein
MAEKLENYSRTKEIRIGFRVETPRCDAHCELCEVLLLHSSAIPTHSSESNIFDL